MPAATLSVAVAGVIGVATGVQFQAHAVDLVFEVHRNASRVAVVVATAKEPEAQSDEDDSYMGRRQFHEVR